MIFNSYQFIFFFLPVVLIGYYGLAKYSFNYSAIWIGACSLGFYASLSIQSLPVLCLSILMNYFIGRSLIARKKQLKNPFLLYSAITLNIGFLFLFKYLNFFIVNINYFRNVFGYSEIAQSALIFPIGISFFTFTQIAYLIDCSRGKVSSTSFRDYIIFVTFFPHLLAGPIIHHKQIIDQIGFSETYKFRDDRFLLGLSIFILGLSKKVLLADPLSSFADPIFALLKDGHHIGFMNSWVGALSYTFQLYFDFSGYSDMAVGISLMLGIILPINFNGPLLATSIIDFWQKWHITLTTYFGQYLYAPLTLSAARSSFDKGRLQKTISTLIYPTFLTFILIGFWHGASWTFIVFGLMHGFYIVVNNLWRDLGLSKWVAKRLWHKTLNRIYWSITFLSVLLGFVMFRSDSVNSALHLYKSMFSAPVFSANLLLEINFISPLFFIILAFIVIFIFPSTARLTDGPKSNENAFIFINSKWTGFLVGALLMLCLLSMNKTSPFLYFEF